MFSICRKLNVARNILIEIDRVESLIQILLEQKFTQEQADKAELWILRGDWRFKGKSPLLELADFYPSHDQLQNLSDDTYVVLPRTRLISLLRDERTKTELEYQKRNYEAQIKNKDVERDWLGLGKRILEQDELINDYIKERLKIWDALDQYRLLRSDELETIEAIEAIINFKKGN